MTLLARLALVVEGTVVFFGLAVLGWGGFATFFSHSALILLPLPARIRAEERLLRTQFGAEYDAYCARTSRLIPGLD